MTQDGEASASAAAERPPGPVEQEEMRVLLQDRQNFPSLRHSSHPSDLDRRQNGRSFDAMAASFRSDTKTRAKNIAAAPEGAEEWRQAGEPGLSSGLRPLILSHARHRDQQPAEINATPSEHDGSSGSSSQQHQGRFTAAEAQ